MTRLTAAAHALFVGFPMWLGVSLLWAPLFIFGIPLVGYLVWRDAWHWAPSRRYPKKHKEIGFWNAAWLDYLYGNDEDGVTGDMRWWPTYCDGKGWSFRKGVFMWSAIRNPVNNFRFTKLVDYGLSPDRIRYVGNSEDCALDLAMYRQGLVARRTFWFYAWHGIYPAFWLIHARDDGTHLRIRFGWKHTPAFRKGIPAGDYREQSESFTPAQFGWRRAG